VSSLVGMVRDSSERPAEGSRVNMPDLDGSKRHYRLFSADSHVNEPPELWVERVGPKFKERAPRMEHFEHGDGWVIDGVGAPINFGLNVSAGMRRHQRRPWLRWDEVPENLKTAKGRLADQDEDNVDGEVLYPTPRLFEAMITAKDRDFHLALIRAYNDWTFEFASPAPDRLLPMVVLPNCGVDDALREIERVSDQARVRGVVIGQYPAGGLDLDEDNDPVWAALVERDLPVHIHVKLTDRPPSAFPGPSGRPSKLAADPRFFDAPERILQFIGTKTLDRFPKLKVVFAEADCGWLPYFKEQLADREHRHAFGAGAPSRPVLDYFSQFFFAYITDHVAVRERYSIGVSQMLWSSDYPHTGSNWPSSWRTISADFANLPDTELRSICAGNAVDLYHLHA
jgi:predicted TIM-barrel fold metal-dependent hydrolase